MNFSILITCLLDNVWIFSGEVTCEFLPVVELSLSLEALYGLFTIFSTLMRDARKRKMKIIRVKAGLENLQIQFIEKNCKMHALINPFTSKISIVILRTVCHTILVMVVWRIWSWIN